jgi:hypothetical protein
MPELTLCLSDVLYRTRGRDWDYAFLLQPPPLLGEGWYTLHRRIFAHVEPESVPTLLRGALGVGTGQPFFATAFTDSVRRDSQARPIAHYLVWLGPAAEAAPGLSFGPALVQALSGGLDAIFELGPAALQGGEKPLDVRLRQRFSEAVPSSTVTLDAALTGPVRWLGTLSV